jgi:hypothetical protein
VPTDVLIRIRFAGYPDPDTLSSDSVGLTTGFYWVPAIHRVDLLHQTVTFRPWQRLSSHLGYVLHVMPTLHSLQGCPAPYTVREFRTGDGPANADADPVAPPFSDILATFDRRCGGDGGCHLNPALPGACQSDPASGLSLCASEAWDALVGVRSRQESRLKLVDPGDSARSYLLRKVIPAAPDGAPPPTVLGHRDPPGEPLSDAEIEALAAWIDDGAAH